MTRSEQEFHAIDNRGDETLIISSTHPRWTRQLERLEAQGFARRTRTTTALEDGERKTLGGEWELDREAVALRLTVRRKATPAQKAAAAKAAAARFDRETNAGAMVGASDRRGNDPQVVRDGQTQEALATAVGEREATACRP